MLDDVNASCHHLSAVKLLTRMHSMCPDGRCEEILLGELVCHNKVMFRLEEAKGVFRQKASPKRKNEKFLKVSKTLLCCTESVKT